MKFQEDKGLHYSIKQAIETQSSIYNDSVSSHLKYVEGFDFQISVTTLNKSPRQNHLFRRHASEIVMSYWDRLHLLDGSIFHYLMESHPDPEAITEARFGKMLHYKGKRIYVHGAADCFYPKEGVLIDFKRSTVQSISMPKDDYVFQLNALRWIIQRQPHTYEVKEIKNIFFLKDWERNSVNKVQGYPTKPIITVTHPIWTDEEMKSELSKRVRKHFDSMSIPDNELPFCTLEEKWQRNKFRVFGKKKNGEWSKSSKGTFPARADAELAGIEIGDHKIEEIKGKPIKCIDYCDCSIFCNQRQQEIEQAKNQESQEENDDD